MQLKTILNCVQKFKSFVYGAVRWTEGAPSPTLEVDLQPRANGQATCSGCGRPGPGYERLPPRRFEFVPLWGIKVFWVYAPRRMDCPRCGVKVERMPWADEVCAKQARELKARGYEPVLTKTRWLLLKRPENLTEQQEIRLADLLRYNLSVSHVIYVIVAGCMGERWTVQPRYFAA